MPTYATFLKISIVVLVWTLSLAGWGVIFDRFFLRGSSGTEGVRASALPLLGLVVLIPLCNLVHLFAPLNGFVSLGAGVLGFFFFASRLLKDPIARKKLANIFALPLARAQTGWSLSLVWLFLTVLILSYICSRQPPAFDAGLYHLQVVLWTAAEPVALGLANVFPNYGFNSAWLTFAALIKFPFLGQMAYFCANGLLTFVTSLFFLGEVREFERKDGSGFFALFVFVEMWLPGLLIKGDLGGQSTDLPATLVGLVALYAIWKWLDRKRNVDSVWLKIAIATSALSATLKLSVIPLLFGVCALILIEGFRRQKFKYFNLSWPILWIVGPWILHGFFLSGCLAFPLEKSCLNVPWRALPEEAIQSARWITAWARNPGISPDIVLKDWSWIRDWWERFYNDPFIKACFYPLIIGTFGSAFLSHREKSQTSKVLPIVAILSACIAFWFLQAPDIRFARSFLFTLAHIPLVIASSRFFQNRAGTREHVTKWAFAVLPLLVAVHLLKHDTYPPYKEWPVIQHPQVSPRETQSGLILYEPIDETRRCWDAPRPCSGIPDLRLLRSEVLGHSLFRIQNRPNP